MNTVDLTNSVKIIFVLQFYFLYLPFAVFSQSDSTKCSSEPLMELVKDCNAKDSIINFQIRTSKKLKKSLNGAIKIDFDKGSIKDATKLKKCIRISPYFIGVLENRVPILSISSHFEDNIPYGETNIYYANQTMILIQLNQFGQYCGIEKHFNEKNDLIKIKNSHDLEWVKMNKFYFILMKDNAPTKYLSSADFKFLINCKYIGEKLAIDCKQFPMISTDGFPCHKESKNGKPTHKSFGLLDLENGFEMDLEKETILANDLCKNSSSIYNWLQTISSVPIIRSDNANIESMIGLDTNKISIDISESKIPLSLQPNYVEIYQGGNSIHNATINFDPKSGMALISLTPGVKETFDELFKSAAKYLPFTFSFITHQSSLFEKTMGIQSKSIEVQGYICKNGVLCGYIKKYGTRSRDNSVYVCNEVHINRLVYFGFHEGEYGKPIGPIYKLLFGGSVIVSENGSFSGNNIAYIYKNADFALKGKFDENANLIEGQKVRIEKEECNEFGLKKLFYSEPVEPSVFYHYNPPNNISFGDQPHVPDEVAVEYYEVMDSPNLIGEGAFATKDIKVDTIITLYGGIRLDKYETSDFTPSGEYKQNIGLGTGYVDIPVGFKDLSKFSGTMGHKLNHLFNNTCQIRNVDSARFGIIGCLTSIKNIKKGDELFSNYGPYYSNLLKPGSNSKTSWYYDCWQKFKTDHPEEIEYIKQWEEISKNRPENMLNATETSQNSVPEISS